MIPFFRKMLLFVTLLGCQNNTTNSENWETHGSVESEDKNLFIFIIFLHTGDVRIKKCHSDFYMLCINKFH